MIESEQRFEAQPNVGNHFAWLRTVMALQRTLMAAVRTSVSLIGFGFTVAQFFQRLQGNLPEGFEMLRPEMPRNVGLVLIATGIVTLAIFTMQYRNAMRYFRTGPFAAIAATSERPMHRSTYIYAIAVIAIGILAFASVFARF
jgi:putative membrane protein